MMICARTHHIGPQFGQFKLRAHIIILKKLYFLRRAHLIKVFIFHIVILLVRFDSLICAAFVLLIYRQISSIGLMFDGVRHPITLDHRNGLLIANPGGSWG